MSTVDIISSHVDVSPNEYVTKFSINRNFLKLVENDKTLSALIDAKLDEGQVHSYIQGKIYSSGSFVFFKTSDESQSLYLLSCSSVVPTSEPPATYINTAGDEVVKNSLAWKIVGIPAGMEVNPRDYALEYVNSNKNEFISCHLEDTSLSAHPTAELGMDNSTIVFKTLENIKEERRAFFYPNLLKSLNSDDTTIAGYMRKWDNGLLEYDIIFKVGSKGEYSSDGQALISANNLEVYHRNLNFLYFKDNADFRLFDLTNDYHVTVNGTKQVNLNTSINAYYGEIKFPEEFRDLNYMVFTSQEKNVEVETQSVNNEVIPAGSYDSRLKIEGLAVVGCDLAADYEKAVKIPNQVVNIGSLALAYIEETNSLPVKIEIDPSNSKLVNIEDRAFESTAIKQITIPKATRCIGTDAFCNCLKLEQVDIYVNRDKTKQPRIDINAFDGATNLSTINLHYYSDPLMFAASLSPEEEYETESRISAYSTEYDLSSKLTDEYFLKIFGINNGSTKVTLIVIIDNRSYGPLAASGARMLAAAPKALEVEGEEQEEEKEDVDYVTVNIEDLLASVKGASSLPARKSRMMLAATPLMKAEPTPYLSDYFILADIGTGMKAITGWDTTQLTSNVCLDFNDSSLEGVVRVGSSAIQNCSFLTSIVISNTLTSIGPSAFVGSNNIEDVYIARDNFSSLNVGQDAFNVASIKKLRLDTSSNLFNASYSFNCNIDEVVLSGSNTAESKLLPGLRILRAVNLSAVGFTVLASGALSSITSLDNLHLFSPGVAPSYSPLLISREAFAIEENSKIDMMIHRGNYGLVSCGPYSFANLAYSDGVSPLLDLSNMWICTSAFTRFDVDTLRFINWKKGTLKETAVYSEPCILSTFDEGAFADTGIDNIYFQDLQDMHEVSAAFIVGEHKNILSCDNGMIVRSKRGIDPSKIYGYTVFNGELVATPESTWLFIDEDGVVLSCNWEQIILDLQEDEDGRDVIVPFGVVAISSDAFNLGRPTQCISSIASISLPVTLLSVYDRAFYDIRDLKKVQFEAGTELEHIGETLFSDVSLSIPEFVLRKEVT